jgi:sulfonate dioxygenase
MASPPIVTNSITPAVLAYQPPDSPLEEFTPAKDRAFFADTEKTSLFLQDVAVEELTPWIGTELKGIQLSKLTNQQKDDLALLVAEVDACEN